MNTRLPEVHVHGEGRAAGRAYGEAARDLVLRHHEMIVRGLAARGMELPEAQAHVAAVRAATAAVAPALAAEVDGVGEGAGLTPDDGWILQLRAELTGWNIAPPECSSLALVSPARPGGPLAAQNADLPPQAGPLFLALRRTFADRPALLTITPAGQLGHHGMNEAGVTVFGNFLRTPEWGVGVPRYLLTRLALAETSRHAAADAVAAVPRSGPRNLLIADDEGALDIETTPSGTARLDPSPEGVLPHTNHFLTELAVQESAPPEWLRNSRARLARLEELLTPDASPEDVAEVLADRAGAPDALCHLAADAPHLDIATVISTIAEIRARRLRVCAAPPGPYALYPVKEPT
ncbi:isopenicillin-N N-acyltransferase-like protein [Thermocatellispora tengchongensis]|uniref:Isopenicillin-N N-acyltransferase-like protein n=1 Tax=Thermocatellispora tengchongensis TaxID=1073253 RepID=A0A840PNB1_9ACTN|nr:C45 family peptidase [Thermocatellispora tengchongensis]MBB5138537.1 isopenicillin-N N-acyltransferase-like protein [Thermocatellispora tengchongensis]